MGRSRTKGRRAVATLSLSLLVAALWGCANLQVPKIDPSGERIFSRGPIRPDTSDPAYRSLPGGPFAWNDTAVTLAPQVSVATVGSEVVLLAGVLGPAG